MIKHKDSKKSHPSMVAHHQMMVAHHQMILEYAPIMHQIIHSFEIHTS